VESAPAVVSEEILTVSASAVVETLGVGFSAEAIAAQLQNQLSGAQVADVHLQQTAIIPVQDDGTICTDSSTQAAAENAMGYSLGINSGPFGTPPYDALDGSSMTSVCEQNGGRRMLQAAQSSSFEVIFSALSSQDKFVAVTNAAFASTFISTTSQKMSKKLSELHKIQARMKDLCLTWE